MGFYVQALGKAGIQIRIQRLHFDGWASMYAQTFSGTSSFPGGPAEKLRFEIIDAPTFGPPPYANA